MPLFQKDIALDADGNFKIANGDFVIAESTRQNMQLCIVSEKGEWKETPDRGVGAFSYLEDDQLADILSEINSELSRDGMTVQSVRLTNGKINVNGEYSE